jgi:hypothetical protein
MADLAEISETGNYFLGRPGRCDWKKIGLAAELMGGSPSVIWDR